MVKTEAANFPSLRSALNSAFKDRRRILVAMALVLVCAGLAAGLKQPSYTAQSTLLVLASDEYAYRPDALSSQAGAATAQAMARDAILSAELSILTGPGLIKAALAKIGPERVYPALAQGGLFGLLARDDAAAVLEKAAERFKRNVSVMPDKYGSTLTVSFKNPDARVAADMVNTLLAAYLEKRAAVYSNAQSGLLEGEVEKARATLERLSNELQAYQSQQEITEFGTQMDLLLRRSADLERAQQAAETEIEEAARRLSIARTQVQATPAQVVQYADSETDKRVQTARDSLGELRRQESELRQTYTDASPKVISIRRQIEAMEAEIAQGGRPDAAASAVRRGVNEVHTTAQLDLMRAESALSAAQARKRQLQSQVADVDGQIKDMQGKRTPLETLGRQKLVAEQTFLAATRALQERRITEDISSKKSTNVRVIEPAEPPAKPAPVRLAIVAGGVMLSLLTGLTTAVLGAHFRRTYLAPDRVERELGIPVLASIADRAGAERSVPVLGRPTFPAA